MDKLIFTALGAASNQGFQRVQLTNDLANISTIGYKRSQQSRPESAFLDGPGLPTRFQPIIASRVEQIMMGSGTQMRTGNPLDISMNDATVLGVQAEDGNIAFTRRGDLRVSADGFLETGTGDLVLAEGGGPITVPVNGVVTIAPDGTVFFQEAGPEAGEAQALAQLLLRDSSATVMTRRTDGLFEALGSGGLGGDITTGPDVASLTSGSLEGSNVSAVEVMVNLMDFYRSFETQMKVIKSTEELDKDGSRLMRA